MIINIVADAVWLIDELLELIIIKKTYASRDTIWYEGFYIKICENMLEINIFDNSINEQDILKRIIQPLSQKRKNIWIRIQQGRKSTQYILYNNNQTDCVYNECK